MLNKKKIKNIINSTKEIIKFGGVNTTKVLVVEHKSVLEGKKIVVTGASSGIGYQIAKKCVDLGAKVIITGRNEEKLKIAIDKIGDERVKYLVWDIGEIDVIEGNLRKCIEWFEGDIDVLINNAGVQPEEFFPSVTEKEWDRIYNINSKGTFFMSQYFCDYWMKNPRLGSYRKIINIDSQGGFVGATYPYRMSKWDIRGLTQGLGIKMAPYGVIVNGVAPGVVKTEMQQFTLEQGNNNYCESNLLKRVAVPEEIAELVAFMISDACNFIVGQTILIDGGYSIK